MSNAFVYLENGSYLKFAYEEIFQTIVKDVFVKNGIVSEIFGVEKNI